MASESVRSPTFYEAERKPSLEGYLHKKSPKSFASVHVWQRRYFVLNNGAGMLTYYSSKPSSSSGGSEVALSDKEKKKGDAKQIGFIPLDRCNNIEVHSNKKNRFDLHLEGGRLFQFKAETKEEMLEWVSHLSQVQKAVVKPLTSTEASAKFWKANNKKDNAKDQSGAPQVDQVDLTELMLETVFMFSMTAPQIRTLTSFFTLQQNKADDTLFGKNDSGAEFYVIIEGQVELFDLATGGFLCQKRKHDFLGIGTLKQGKRLVRAICATDVLTVNIKRKDLNEYVGKNPEMKNVVLPLMGFNPAKHLKTIDMFKDITDLNLRLLGTLVRYVGLNPGDVLFEEGLVGRTMYIVFQGLVKATTLEETGVKKDLCSFNEGEVFGEIGLIMDIPRTASCEAVEASLLLELHKDDFRHFLTILPAEANLFAIMKSRVASHFRKYKVPFFEAIPSEKYARLAELCAIETIAPDTTLFSEGDIGNRFYIIAYGQVKILVKKPNKAGQMEDLEIARMGAGKYFGEVALVTDAPRTATVTTVSRCVILSITKENFQNFFKEAPEALADFEIKLARYNVELRSVLYHPVGLEYFTQHITSEYSQENIDFWKACIEYRKLAESDASHDALFAEAQRIYTHFVSESSEQQVNLKSHVSTGVDKSIQSGSVTAETFADAELEIFNLMSEDSFRRFKDSELFQKFLQSADSYERIDK